jgi:hypothetical protein
LGKPEVTDASHLNNQTNVGEAEIDAPTKYKYYKRHLEALAGYGAFMKGTINPMPEDMKNLDIKATYIL